MHLRIQRDVRLNNVKHLRQYNLRYTVANLASLLNVASDGLMSSFTLVGALAIGAKKYTLKCENMKKCIRMEITVLNIVIWK